MSAENQSHDKCPQCGSIVYFRGTQALCHYCKNTFSVKHCCPGVHREAEIDPEFPDKTIQSPLTRYLLPAGTVLCSTCGRIYPESLSTCPEQVEMAVRMFESLRRKRARETKNRVVAFLRTNQRVLVDVLRRRLLAFEKPFEALDMEHQDFLREVVREAGIPDETFNYFRFPYGYTT